MASRKGSLLDVAKEFASLGVVAFGGPPAHVAMMLDRLVHGLGWIDEASFTSLFALTQACLLYTSPSPRDGLLSRMPSSA